MEEIFIAIMERIAEKIPELSYEFEFAESSNT